MLLKLYNFGNITREKIKPILLSQNGLYVTQILGHLRLELAYDSRTVKKWAAAAGHFRFYHRNGARTGYACEFVEI